MKTYLQLFILLFCAVSFSQSTIKGKVTDNTGLPLPGANIVVAGTATGAFSDIDGNYTLNFDQNPPFSIRVSYTGFESQTIEVTSRNQTIDITLTEGSALDEVIVSASRTPERIFESPVTVERFGLKEIKNTASSDFYDGLENIKGVDINTNSLTFKSINTRGFATFANTRFMQLVDGMDNSSPALNFPLGNLVGMVETDVKSIELLPGASSALYGANAFNGILFMTSKSPFDHQGISASFKQGITSQDAGGDNSYVDLGFRAAYKFSEYFAAKVNFGYLKGTDWTANNVQGIDGNAFVLANSTRTNDTNYNGVNVYGDEVSTNIRAASGLDIIPDVDVSRTGYNESALTEYNAESVKADWGLYFRPWANDFEIQYVGKVGTGSTIYQGANRYTIDNFFQQQHKIEVKNDNFHARGYVVTDNAGDSYDMVFTGININRAWKSDTDWFGEYIATFAGIELSGNPQGLTDAQKHAAARTVADTGRFEPGSPEFQAAFNRSINDPDLSTGSKFQDESKYYHADGNYNFTHLWDVVEVQVGGSFREYELNSGGTIYTDVDGPINYSEFGIYTQLQKKLELNEDMELKLTGSLRYDKSEFFDGFFSPRISAGLTVNKNHNFRASFQTGFRNPTTQDLFIGLDVGRAILVGGAPNNPERDVRTYPVSSFGQNTIGLGSTITKDATGAYNNSYSSASVVAFAESGDPNDLVVGNSSFVEPEQVTAYEVGYRGKIKGFIIDASAYYNSYKDFLSNETVISPFYGGVDANSDGVVDTDLTAFAALREGDFQAYQTYTNTDADVSSYGASIGVNSKIFNGFDLGVNYTFAVLDFDREDNPDIQLNFNTPEHKFKASFGKTQLFENFGFNVAWRWTDSYLWEATFAQGIVPAYSTVDAQINYTIPSLKSVIKVGATNLTGHEYFNAYGTGLIGSQFYASLTINNL